MRRKILHFVIFLCSFSTGVYAEIEDQYIEPQQGEFAAAYITQGLVDGEKWKEFTNPKKWAYLLGYEDGFIAHGIFYQRDKKQFDLAMSSLPASVKEVPMDDLIKMVDKIYTDKRNFKIPVGYVLIAVRNQLMGADSKKIEQYLESLR